MASSLVECVPNVSEGRDVTIVDRLCEVVSATPGVRLLHRTSDPDHNRSVLTFIGAPERVQLAALALTGATLEIVDLRAHTGVHPRIGAIDVIPLVPLREATLCDCAELAEKTAARLWERYRLPSYLYGHGRRPLEQIRRATFDKAPDFGTGRHATAGAVAIGARPFLVAWNVLLASGDLALARRIARGIRAANGGFPGVKALGLPLASQSKVQVSINTTDFETAPLTPVFEAVRTAAAAGGVATIGAELIGLIPQAALADLPWLNLRPESVLESWL